MHSQQKSSPKLTYLAEEAFDLQVKRLLCPGLIDSNQALQNELSALRDMYISLQQQIDALSDKHMLFQTTERSLVSTDKKVVPCVGLFLAYTRHCCMLPLMQLLTQRSLAAVLYCLLKMHSWLSGNSNSFALALESGTSSANAG